MVDAIWQEFLTLLKEEAGSRVVETWFKAVSFKQWDRVEHVAYLQAPNSFVKDWIKSHYSTVIETHLKRLLQVNALRITFYDISTEPIVEKQYPVTTEVVRPAMTSEVAVVPAKMASGKHTAQGMRTHSFDSFIVGPNNSLAYAAAKAIAENPGTVYNPLFIYGDSGLGKTHLLHAIGNEIKMGRKKMTTLYQTADRFVNEFINAIRFDKVHAFQAKYKAIDVLLIDDIQFISNKDQTQEAFFHIFNALYDAQKQIVFSSDTFPQDIQGLAERLRYRLASGLVVDMYVPTLETKIAILKKKAELSHESLTDDVAYFIASRDMANVRELEGSLIRVLAFASLTNQAVSLDLAHKVLGKSYDTMHTKNGGIDRVMQCMAKYYPYSLHDLQSKNRNKEISFARQVAMYLIKKVTDKSLRDIGVYLGGRDHSTVMHALDKVAENMQKNPELSQRLQRIEEDILGK